MKKFFKKGKHNQKKLLVLFSVFIAFAAILAFALMSAAGINPSEYLLTKVTGGYGAGWGSSPSTYTFGGNRSSNPTLTTDPSLRVDLKANNSDGPITVPKNTKVTLSWGPTNATKCTASNGWSGSRSPKGSTATGTPTVSKTYTLTCSGKGGTASDSVTVNVDAASSAIGSGPTSVDSGTPTLSFTVNGDPNRATVAYNTPVTLAWKATNVSRCAASGSWSGQKALSGRQVTPKLTASVNYIMRCDTRSGNFITVSLTVDVGAAPAINSTKTTVDLKVNGSDGPITIPYNTSVTLSWTSVIDKPTSSNTPCFIGGANRGSLAYAGSLSTGLLQDSTTYNLECYDSATQYPPYPRATDSVTVNVAAPTNPVIY